MFLVVGVLKRACFSMENASPLCINMCMYCCNLNLCLGSHKCCLAVVSLSSEPSADLGEIRATLHSQAWQILSAAGIITMHLQHY